ncbi:precorrin-3B synthase [Actinoplanes missouriensis]|uniref:precorrin-3B synthase n=1 Tax=Actinoplanes missouriensis TaxID=1866 RepID=UPI0012FB8FFC|nr:precorrin-3B synthase [Actinoplanes missouriensis]
MTPLRQSDTDACPGALRLHAAADGLLARVRLPAGVLSGEQLRALRELTEQFGDGFLELTSRANLQVRGVQAKDAETLAARLRAAGLLPSATHDAVRNIAAPVLAGPVIRALVARLDAALIGDPALSGLPGKFLFAIGHVPLAADVTAVPAGTSPAGTATGSTIAGGTTRTGTGGRFVIRLGGHDTGIRVDEDAVVPTMLAAAHAFLAEREAQRSGGPAAWRLRELTDGPSRVTARVRAAHDPAAAHEPAAAHNAAEAHGKPAAAATTAPRDPEPATPVEVLEPGDLLGVLDQPGSPLVAVGALVPLGRLGGVPMKVLEKATRLVITPWRGVLVTDLPRADAAPWADQLIDSGLALAADSPWVGVTACAGRPGCAKSLADVRADATRSARFVDGLPVHWVGCARACGSPAGRHVQVQATPVGYRVSHPDAGAATDTDTDTVDPRRDLGAVVAAARRP